jgi:hypothetical protein
MATKNLIYIIPSSIVFNKESIPVFESFSSEDSSILFSTLYLNNKEVIQKLSGDLEFNYCFYEPDRNHLTEEFSGIADNIHFYKLYEGVKYFRQLLKNIPPTEFPNIIFVVSNSIGIKPSDMLKTISLLNQEEYNIVVGRSVGGKISIIAFNYYEDKLFDAFTSFKFSYEEFLPRINKIDYYFYLLEGFLTVDDLNDFKNLYKILSSKDSIDFCSHEMHERFTHLFIEYKDLL